MSALSTYNAITTYISGVISSTTGLSNLTVFIGDPVESPTRPYARISEAQPIVTEYQGFVQYFSTIRVMIGIEALYQADQTFRTNIDGLITELNSNGGTICGVEFFNVVIISCSSEDAKYSRAEITVEAQFYHS